MSGLTEMLKAVSSIYPENAETMAMGVLQAISRAVTLLPISSETLVIEYLIDRYKKSNNNTPIPIIKDGNLSGVLIAHQDLLNIARFGKIDRPIVPRHVEMAVNGSTLIITEDYFHSIGRAHGKPDIFPERYQAIENLLKDQFVRNTFIDKYAFIPNLKDREIEELCEIYNNSAYHILTHGNRAEIIWKHAADLINNIGIQFNNIGDENSDELNKKDNGNDGGIDDLRECAHGLLATQVKGAKKYDPGFKNEHHPEMVALDFFNHDDRIARKNKQETRFELFPCLAKQAPGMPEGVTIDDTILIHYVGVGKWLPPCRIVEGFTKIKNVGSKIFEPIKRTMITSRLELVVLKPSFYYTGAVRADASSAGKFVGPFARDFSGPFAGDFLENAMRDIVSSPHRP